VKANEVACPAVEVARPLRICYFGTYRAGYSRNQIMLEALRRAGADVVECHVPLWAGVEDRVQAARGGWARPAFWRRVLAAYARLLRQYRRVGAYDVLMLGYPGQFDVFLARPLAWLRRRPLAWDVFMSIYLIASERGLERGSRLTVRGLRWLEALALRLPDVLIADTADYVEWYCRTYRLRPERFRLVPTGADDRIFQPLPLPAANGDFRVLYYGSFIPNHGVAYMIEAARLIAPDEGICFELVGDGPDKSAAMRAAGGLPHVVFAGWLPQAELVARAAAADVCLGAFGQTPQSLMTVQNKIYEALAMARPVVTGDSPAVRGALRHGTHAWLVDRSTPSALAAALRLLQGDAALRRRLAEDGHRLFVERYALNAIGVRSLEQLVTTARAPGSPAG
jgi:glycosyltransferase involved in cell wall biosynthesis